MRILVLGVSGMLGRAVWQVLGQSPEHDLIGASRSPIGLSPALSGALHQLDVLDDNGLRALISHCAPHFVINAVGLIKQLEAANDPLVTVPINTLLPHRLAKICADVGARLVHVSTDCVFSGDRGDYGETDRPDATDLYGLSKLLGEVTGAEHVLTLRTSIVGREASSANGLVDWFLSQSGSICGYRNAIFSGLTTIAFAEVLRDYVIGAPPLCGLYHLSAAPISKLDLLRIVSDVYGRPVTIVPVDEPRIDRSLNSTAFRAATGFAPKPWTEMIAAMRGHQG